MSTATPVQASKKTATQILHKFIDQSVQQDRSGDPYRGVAVKDSKDQSYTLSAKVSGGCKYQIETLVQSKNGRDRGWRTDSDFLRFCIRLGLEFVACEQKPGEDKLFVTQHNVNSHLDEISRRKELVLAFTSSFEKLHHTVAQLTAQGMLTEAKSAVYDAYLSIVAMEPGETRNNYYRELKSRFSSLMSRHRISLSPKDAVKEDLENPWEHAKGWKTK